MTRSVRTGALLVLVALLGVACASGDDGNGDPASSPSESTSVSPTSTGSGGTHGNGSGNGGGSNNGGTSGGDGGFAYVPWGPNDPPIPTQYAALAASAGTAPRCDDVPDQGAKFWDLAVQVCRAIVDDGPWPDSSSVPAPPPTDNPYKSCLDAELAAMLERALRWHADHPTSHPQVGYGSNSTTSDCQFRIYATDLVDDSEDGEYTAVVRAAFFDDATMTVDGEEVFPDSYDVDDSELQEILFELTATEEPRTVEIQITTDAGTLETAVDLPGTGGTGGTGDAEATPTATATATPPEEQQ